VLLVVDGHFQGQETAEALGGDHFIAAGAFWATAVRSWPASS
jgi:hypothetical protein